MIGSIFFPVIGAVVGSFIGAATLRLPRGEGIVTGRSHCDQCGRTLTAWEMIPVVSYVHLGGRCRTCFAPIAIDQPMAEIASALIGWLAVLTAGSWPAAVALCLFGWTLVALALLDARHFWLPDALTLPLIVAGIVAGLFMQDLDVGERALGAVSGYLALEAVRIGYRWLRGREGLGLGDAKLFAGIGAWLGPAALPWVLIGAGGIGFLFLALKAVQGKTIERLPLGTLMAMAAAGCIPIFA